METNAMISLPANNYTIISEENLNNNNPAEKSETDTKALFANEDYEYPGVISAVQLLADEIGGISQMNLNNNNPREMITNKKLISRVIYEEIDYNDNPNAFRDSYSLGTYTTLPDEKSRTDNDTVRRSAAAEKKKVQHSINDRYDNFNEMKYAYKTFGKKIYQ